MTREEAILYNENLKAYMEVTDKYSEYKFLAENYEALDMANKALEDADRRIKGKWIKYGTPRCNEQHYKCTNCDDYINFGAYADYYVKDFRFCPHCGAEMESEEME